MSTTTITPRNNFHRTVFLTGDKSISHRALMFAALKKQTTHISGLSEAADPMSTRSVLAQLGVAIRKKGEIWEVKGVGRKGFTVFNGVLDVGNSGTTIRLMSGILAAQPFVSELTGDASIRKRPMNRIIKPLTQMGASIESVNDGRAPIKIHGSPKIFGIDYLMEISSAQVKSCILLAGLYTKEKTIVREKVKTRDHTERMLNLTTYEKDGLFVTESSADHDFDLPDITVPGDPSSAAFWAVAGSILPDTYVRIENVLLNPTRIGFVEALKQMGADITITQTGECQKEPVGTLEVRSAQLKGIHLSGDIIPSLVDEIPILCIAAAYAEGETEIRGAEELRVKECDRIAAMVQGIKAMGGEAVDFPDGLKITGTGKLKGASIETFHDHRIAMSFAIAALRAEGETLIQNSECVKISYPAFWEILAGTP
ncbi:MAG: 3-phosphoshikimate 1-carboxyvinyltransferase [Bacteroidetes bacterium]|nr:3-phosphoshikimate 1-carboxyvinyltransferase [Bacteroidota bacterium]